MMYDVTQLLQETNQRLCGEDKKLHQTAVQELEKIANTTVWQSEEKSFSEFLECVELTLINRADTVMRYMGARIVEGLAKRTEEGQFVRILSWVGKRLRDEQDRVRLAWARVLGEGRLIGKGEEKRVEQLLSLTESVLKDNYQVRRAGVAVLGRLVEPANESQRVQILDCVKGVINNDPDREVKDTVEGALKELVKKAKGEQIMSIYRWIQEARDDNGGHVPYQRLRASEAILESIILNQI